MFPSQLLSNTESHGLRAALAAVVWIIGRLAQIYRGLRNLACGNRQPARMDVGSGSWLRIFFSDVACACQEPVLWFDIMGRRDGPDWACALRRLTLRLSGPNYSPAPVLAEQAHRRCE
jgi:hypothetical protein